MPQSRREFLGRSATLAGGVFLAQAGRANQAAGRVEPPPAGLFTPAARSAAGRGLSHLARTQAADGSWSVRTRGGNAAVTSLAGMAFLAGGHVPGFGPHGDRVARAAEFILSCQRDEPRGFLHAPREERNWRMYSHGFSALFLAQVYGMAGDAKSGRRIREALQRAVGLIVSSQNAKGGWRYTPEPREADVSVTICQVMALRAARNVGVSVPKSTVDRCVEYVKSCQMPDGGFSYLQGQGGSAFARSAAGVVALYSAGIYKGPAVERGLAYLMSRPPGRGADSRRFFYYGQYYAAQAMWTAGGDFWNRWYPAVREELLSRARFGANRIWTDSPFGPAYATAMACIVLQIPNDYLPILQK